MYQRNMGSDYQPLSASESLLIDLPECFICREVQLETSDPLQSFCDCKNLAHHVCLATWIQTGCGSNNRLWCIVCRAKYEVRRTSPWHSVVLQWQTWLVLSTVVVFLGLVPFIVHWLMTAFDDPPPPIPFKVAAASFGLLMESLLISCSYSFLSSRYHDAKRRAFIVLSRGHELYKNNNGDRWDGPEASSSQVDNSKVDGKIGPLSFLKQVSEEQDERESFKY